MNVVVPVLIGVLALAGMADSAYLSLLHYGILHTEAPLASGMCGIHASACGAVLQARQSSMFGIPSSAIGLAYFGILVGAAGIRLATGKWTMPWLLLALIGIALVFSGYLVYAMFFEIRKVCPYCLTAHGINAALAALYAVALRW